MDPVLYYIYTMIMRESSLTYVEYAKVVATYNKSTGQNLMNDKLLERGYTMKQIEALTASNTKTQKSLNLILKPGFENLRYSNFDFYYNLFMQYEKGVMPFPGALVDQPNKIIELFSVLQSLNSEYENRQRAEQQREMKRKRK